MSYELVETVTVGAGGASSIQFTGIAQDGVDLEVKLSARTNKGGTDFDTIIMRLNSSTTNYEGRIIRISDNIILTNSTNALGLIGGANTSNTPADAFSNCSFYILNYNRNRKKQTSVRGGIGAETRQYHSETNITQWIDTSAITSIELISDSGSTFQQYTTASLYKIY